MTREDLRYARLIEAKRRWIENETPRREVEHLADLYESNWTPPEPAARRPDHFVDADDMVGRPALPDREAVELAARIIDPASFEKVRQGGQLDDAEWRCNRARDKATHILAMLIPPGCVVVPLEPTEAMQNAGRIAAFRVLFPRGGPFEEADCQAGAFAAYRAMLAAAPKVTT